MLSRKIACADENSVIGRRNKEVFLKLARTEAEIKKNPAAWKIYSKIKKSWIANEIMDGSVRGDKDRFRILTRIGHDIDQDNIPILASIIKDGAAVRVRVQNALDQPYLMLDISFEGWRKKQR